MPNNLRLLISENAAIRKKIAEFLYCKAKDIRISCLGTGVNNASALLGSDPRQYITRHLHESEHNVANQAPKNVLVRLLCLKNPPGLSAAHAHVEAVREFSIHPLIAPLLGNYRAAVLVAAHVQQNLSSAKEVLRYTLQSTAEQCVYYVSHEFRSLNGLESLHSDELMECCAHAFRLALCGPTIDDSFDRDLSTEERILISTLGILTERTDEVVAATKSKTARRKKRNTKKSSANLNLPRFRMSRCVALMMLANFGMSKPPISAQSGEGLEFAITQKAILTLRCCHSATQVRQVLQCAAPKMSTQATLAALSAAAAKAPKDTLLRQLSRGRVSPIRTWAATNVVLLTPQKRLSRRNETKKADDESWLATPKGKHNLMQLQTIAKVVQKGRPVVICNGSKAPYADVIVVAPRFLCLVQCKYGSRVGKAAEMNKIFDNNDNKDITDCLCHIAGVHPRDITVLFPTTSGGLETVETQTARKCNLHIARTAAKGAEHLDVLFPFTWPSTPLQRDERYEFPVTGEIDFAELYAKSTPLTSRH